MCQECKDGFVVKPLLIELAIFHLKEKTVSPPPKLLKNYFSNIQGLFLEIFQQTRKKGNFLLLIPGIYLPKPPLNISFHGKTLKAFPERWLLSPLLFNFLLEIWISTMWQEKQRFKKKKDIWIGKGVESTVTHTAFDSLHRKPERIYSQITRIDPRSSRLPETKAIVFLWRPATNNEKTF